MTFAGITDVGAYVVGCIAIILLPGPNSLFVMSTSAIDGRVRGWAAVAGVLVADTVFIIGSGVGLVALLHALPGLFDVLRWAGSAYLAMLGARLVLAGWRQWRERGARAPVAAPAAASRTALPSLRAVFNKAVAIGVLNPKALMFYVAFFPQFADPVQSNWLTFTTMGVILQAFSLVYLILLVISGARIAEAARRSAWVRVLGNTATGVLFIGFGAKIAAARTVQ